MNFPIEIRHAESGLAKVFHNMQEVANFLAGKVHAEWEGWSHLGELPEPQAPVDESAPASNESANQDPVGSLSLAPDGVFVEGAGLVPFEALADLGLHKVDEAVDIGAAAPEAPARTMRAKMAVTGRTVNTATVDGPEGSSVKAGDTLSEQLSFTCVAKSGGYPSDGSDEDNSFARWSPAGRMDITVQNPALFGKLVSGDTFYVDFTAANPKPAA